MLSFLLALSRRLHQPTRLAVVVTPLAFLVCCALPVQTLSGAQQPSIQTQTTVQHRDYRASNSSAGRLQVVSAASVPADKGDWGVPKAAWPLGKSQLARRTAERWAPGVFVNLGAFTLGSSPVAVPTTPKVFDASSPEYLTLRQLRL